MNIPRAERRTLILMDEIGQIKTIVIQAQSDKTFKISVVDKDMVEHLYSTYRCVKHRTFKNLQTVWEELNDLFPDLSNKKIEIKIVS